MFRDRDDAGRRLAEALEKYRGKGVLVLAIPRGGVRVGARVAEELGADLSMVVARKLPFPDSPEAGFGAVAEDGSAFIFDQAEEWLKPKEIKKIIRQQKKEAERRVKALRNSRPLPVINGRTVILVDDGIAMGSTMRSAIMLCRKRKAGRLVVAAPVAGSEVARQMRVLADEAVILEEPPFFRAVAEVYANWYDVPDDEVIDIMKNWEKNRKR